MGRVAAGDPTERTRGTGPRAPPARRSRHGPRPWANSLRLLAERPGQGLADKLYLPWALGLATGRRSTDFPQVQWDETSRSPKYLTSERATNGAWSPEDMRHPEPVRLVPEPILRPPAQPLPCDHQLPLPLLHRRPLHVATLCSKQVALNFENLGNDLQDVGWPRKPTWCAFTGPFAGSSVPLNPAEPQL